MADQIKTLAESGALRQLRHNDGSEGFVFAYDKDVTDRYIADLRAALQAQQGDLPKKEMNEEANIWQARVSHIENQVISSQKAQQGEAKAPAYDADKECQIPPFGWRCTRGTGHEGPCAAIECPEDVAAVAHGMARLAAAAPAPAALSNADIRKLMHNYSRMHQPGHYSDTEFDCLQDVIGFVRACLTAAGSSQEKDGVLLDFMEAHPEMHLSNHKRKWRYGKWSNYPCDVFDTPREAIYAALAAKEAEK